jgi:predicted ArsR family transcriptional regulator
MYRTPSPGTRQWEILDRAARLGPMTLAQIAEDVGLARTSVQQQVARLVSEGWLDRTRRHGKPGRPADVFALSEQGRRLFAQQTGSLAQHLLEEIAQTEGEPKLRALLKGVGRRTIRRLGPQVGTGTPQERAQRLADTLNEEGVLSDVTRSARGLTLTIHTCPYHGLSQEHGVLCAMDRETVSRLVGARARVHRRIADGHPRCEFELAVGPGGVTTQSKE